MKELLKKLILLAVVIFLAQTISAKIVLIEPLQQELENNDVFDLGVVSPGETIEVSISSESGKALGDWHKSFVKSEDLPPNWKGLESEGGEEALVTRIQVPLDAKQKVYNFRLNLSNPLRELNPESFQARVTVKPDLLNVSLQTTESITSVNLPLQYKLIAVNDSIASHSILVKSNLPLTWFKPRVIKVNHNSTQEIILEVNPQVYGFKKFKFDIYSQETGQRIDTFEVAITVLPTLRGKYLAASSGLPLFTVPLLPFYVVNSIIGLIFP